MDKLVIASVLFILTYIFMIKFVNHRPLVVGISALIFIVATAFLKFFIISYLSFTKFIFFVVF